MFGLGMSEIIFLAVLGLIVIGPKELPELARTIGRFLNELKRSTDVLGDELKKQARVDRIDLLAPNQKAESEHHDVSNAHAPETQAEPEQMELTDVDAGAHGTPETEKQKPT